MEDNLALVSNDERWRFVLEIMLEPQLGLTCATGDRRLIAFADRVGGRFVLKVGGEMRGALCIAQQISMPLLHIWLMFRLFGARTFAGTTTTSCAKTAPVLVVECNVCITVQTDRAVDHGII